MTDDLQASTGDAAAEPGTLVCEGSACALVGAVVGAGTDVAVTSTAPGTAADWLEGLLVKQISNQVDQAGASTPHAG